MSPFEELSTVRRRADIQSDEARFALTQAIKRIDSILREIDHGCGFCEDRGFSWDARQERDLGSAEILDGLRNWPILRRLLPSLRHLRHQNDPIFASVSGAANDAVVAYAVAVNTTELKTSHGEDGRRMQVRIHFQADVLFIAEETIADDGSGRLLTQENRSYHYPDIAFNQPGWSDVKGRCEESTFQLLQVLADRRWRAVVPCDLCGAPVHRYELPGDGSTLNHWSCWSGDSSVPIAPETRAALRDAMPLQDLPAIRALHPDWAQGYCESSDAAFCQSHGDSSQGA